VRRPGAPTSELMAIGRRGRFRSTQRNRRDNWGAEGASPLGVGSIPPHNLRRKFLLAFEPGRLKDLARDWGRRHRRRLAVGVRRVGVMVGRSR